MVWVNGHNMGRFWKIGPTQTLCVPGCYLKKGENEIVVFDIAGPANTVIEGLNRPILDKIVKDENEGKKARSLNLNGSNPVVVASLHNKNEWQTVSFDEPATGRYFCIEVLSAQDANDNAASLAEIELIDEDGNPLSALKWKVLFANSEETVKFANGADKLYDKQESVVWQTKFGEKNGFPHTVVIDLGNETKLTGVKLLNRIDKNQRGKVKDVRLYLQKQAFKIQ